MTLAAVLSGCSAKPDPGGSAGDRALIGPTYARTICVSTRYAHAWIIGEATATNASSDAVSLQSADLTSDHGIRATHIDMITVPRDASGFGVWNGDPPRSMDLHTAAAWRKRRPVDGAVVGAGQQVAFLLHLQGRPGATSGPLHVTYRQGNHTGAWTSNISYALGTTCAG